MSMPEARGEWCFPVAELQSDGDVGCGGLSFSTPADLDRAWALGVFYLKTPDTLNLRQAREFGRSLLKCDSPYRQVPEFGELEGFIALEKNQQTKLALSRQRWDKYYPAEIRGFGRQLDEIGVAIIHEVFRQAGIPERLWVQASGGYSAGAGTAFLNFVHYDVRSLDWGLRPHTDYGFVTILDATAPGLQVEVDGVFLDVPVLPGHFVINFGEALNFITTHSQRPVAAVTHRVLSQKSTDPVRHSIVYFANPDMDGRLLQFDTSGALRGSSSVQDLFTLLENKLTKEGN